VKYAERKKAPPPYQPIASSALLRLGLKSNKRTSEVFGLSQELLQTPPFLAVGGVAAPSRNVRFYAAFGVRDSC
jgi:hypothetical protein